MKILTTIILFVTSINFTLSQATSYSDIVTLEEGKISSILEFEGFSNFKVLNHSGDFTSFSDEVIREATGYADLLPKAYGIIKIDSSASPQIIQVTYDTQNFTAQIISNGIYEVIFDSSTNANSFTYLITPRDSEVATQAAAYPLAGPDQHKIRVHLYDRYGNPPAGVHSFSFIAFQP